MSISTLVTKSLDDVRQGLFDRLASKQTEYAAKGWLPDLLNLNNGIVRGLIELWAWGLYLLYQFLALILGQSVPDSATGGWLDLHAAQVGIARHSATKATGTVYFTRAGNAGNVPIPAGRIVRTKADGAGKQYRFVTAEAVILLDGATEIACLVEAEEYGQAANVTTGQICEIVTVIDGVDAVVNRAGWLITEGNDVETDASLQERYTLQWLKLNGCTKYAYMAWAREVTGVQSVKVLDQHPRGQGTVDVIVIGAAGVPTPQLVTAVRNKILGTGNGDILAPINDDVQVYGPTPAVINFTAQFEILVGGVPETIMAAAESRIRALFVGTTAIDGLEQFGISEDVTRDRITAAGMQPMVKRINTAFADTALAANELAVLDNLNLTWTWALEA